MPRFTIVLVQKETRAYTLDADTEDAAVEQAQAWNEDAPGGKPEGAVGYTYLFDSETVAYDLTYTPVADA